jgi:hypothetical protein
LDADLFRAGFNLKTMIILTDDILPCDADRDALGIRSLFEQVFDGPLAFRIAVGSNLNEDAFANARLLPPLSESGTSRWPNGVRGISTTARITAGAPFRSSPCHCFSPSERAAIAALIYER